VDECTPLFPGRLNKTENIELDTERGDENMYLPENPGMYTRIQAVSVVFSLSPAMVGRCPE